MHFLTPRKLWLLALGLLWIDAPLAGEPAEPEYGNDPAQIEIMTVTASRRERPVREVANSVSVTEASRIRETLVSGIKDLARYTPWLSVSNDPSRFGAAGFTIRGIDANRVATEIDGVPIADSFGVGSYSSARRDLVNPVMLRRVEVLRGPASALYGSDAIGGVVSYATWQPRDLLARTERDWAMGLSTGYQSSDDGVSMSVSAAAGGDHLQGLVIASWQSGSELENTAQNSAARPNPRDYDKSDVLARLVNTGDGMELGLTVDLRHAQALTEVDNLEGQGRFASTTLLNGNDRQTRRRIAADGQFDSGASFADDVSWQAWYQESITDQRTTEERAGSARAPSPTRRFPSFEFSQRTVGADISATRNIEGGGAAHRLLYGAQLRFSQAEEQRDNLLVNLDDGSATRTILGESFPVRDFPTSRITEAALFAHDEILLGEGRLTLIPAMRVEYYELDPRPDEVYREDNPLGNVVSLKEISLSPKLGLVYHLNDKASVFAQYARGFRSPPFEDANIGLDIPLFNIRAIPNPDLVPETSDGFELGLRLASNRLRGSLSAFLNDYDNFIETKVNLGPDPETGVLIFQSQNRERARIYGTELEFAYDLGDWLQGLAINGSLAVTRGEDRGRNLPLNTVDTDRAVLGLRYDRVTERWGAELLTSFAAAKSRVDETALDLFEPPGYGIIDLLAFVRLSDSATLNLGLFNLTDKRFWDWADVRGRPAIDPLIDLYTRPGSNIAATIRLEW